MAGSRVSLINAIMAPIGFFVLSLLIVETFLASVVIKADLSGREGFVWAGIIMFVFVVAVVAILVWSRPEALIFDQDGHLERIKAEFTKVVEVKANIEKHLREAMNYRAQQRFREAIASYEKALALQGDNEEATIGLAVAESYANPTDLLRPIQRLTTVIEVNKNSSKAFYNRACLRLLADEDRRLWLSDLRTALKLAPEMKEWAKNDKDFETVKNDNDFKKIVS